MRILYFFLFFGIATFGQQSIHFDTFYHYEHQKDSVKTNLIYLTSSKNPEFLVNIFDTSKDTVELFVAKYDLTISINKIAMNDFLKSEFFTLKSNMKPADQIHDYQHKSTHYELKVLSRNPVMVYEMIPTLSKRRIRKKQIKLTKVTLLENDADHQKMNVGLPKKWVLENLPKDLHGIASKIEYFDPETKLLDSQIVLLEIIKISKFITIENTNSLSIK